jgi:hypothetical protein
VSVQTCYKRQISWLSYIVWPVYDSIDAVDDLEYAGSYRIDTLLECRFHKHYLPFPNFLSRFFYKIAHCEWQLRWADQIESKNTLWKIGHCQSSPTENWLSLLINFSTNCVNEIYFGLGPMLSKFRYVTYSLFVLRVVHIIHLWIVPYFVIFSSLDNLL